ncbi:unnamed protein product [Psylliodes chrysocephalus]|nr:unnamed protein product [Psylliodes chrysocephala]
MFGIFPVTNVLNLKYNTVCFKWLSPFTFYAIFSILGTLGLTILSFIRMCLSDFKLHLLDSFIFCLNALVVLLVFFRLAMDWPKLLSVFCKTETLLKNYPYQRNLKQRFIMILFVLSTAMFLEHSLAIANTYLNIDEEEVFKMNRTKLEQYFREEFPYIFEYTEYSLPLALLIFYINTCNVFYWCFIDTFIMIMSYAVAYRFKQINVQLKTGINKKHESILYWAKIREDYSQTAILCQKVNKRLGNIILISFGANMYFIVAQLYKGLV